MWNKIWVNELLMVFATLSYSRVLFSVNNFAVLTPPPAGYPPYMGVWEPSSMTINFSDPIFTHTFAPCLRSGKDNLDQPVRPCGHQSCYTTKWFHSRESKCSCYYIRVVLSLLSLVKLSFFPLREKTDCDSISPLSESDSDIPTFATMQCEFVCLRLKLQLEGIAAIKMKNFCRWINLPLSPQFSFLCQHTHTIVFCNKVYSKKPPPN